MKRTWIVLALMLATACIKPVAYVAIQPQDVALEGNFTVKGDPAWNRLDTGDRPFLGQHWTVDGENLDLLQFFTGVAPGNPLVKGRGKEEKRVPTFQARMQPEEIVDLYEALATQFGDTFKRDKLAPCRFAGGDGFRFEFSQVRKSDQVVLKGVGYGVVRRDTLYMMVFQAPRLHFFPTLQPSVERLAESARIAD